MKRSFLFVSLLAIYLLLFGAIGATVLGQPVPAGNDVLILDTQAPAPTATAKPTNPPPSFGEPIVWPDDLDEMFTFIETRKEGYVFEPCKNLQAPYISWGMVLAIKDAAQDDNGAGELWMDGATLKTILSRGGVLYDGRDLRVTEKRIFGALVSSVFTGGIGVCGQADGKPIIYGAGVQRMIDTLVPALGMRSQEMKLIFYGGGV